MNIGAVISDRSKNIVRSEIFEMLARASKYEDVINFGVGEPHFSTPQQIIDHSHKMASEGHTHYTVNAGKIELRRAIAKKLEQENNIAVNPEEEIIISMGAIEALMLLLMAVVNPGDEVIIQDPSWVNYQSQIKLMDGKPVPVTVKEENDFALTAADVEKCITDKTKVIFINSPANPTGGIIEEDELRKIGELALKHDLILVSDETYEKIIYEGEHFSPGSIAELKDRVVSIFSFSKAYAMTGWRIGFAAGPRKIIKEMIKIHDSVGLCTSSISQNAALAALNIDDEIIASMVEEYKENRDILIEGLNELPGISSIYPRGAFYTFANVKQLEGDSLTIARDILDKVQLMTIAGSSFGDAGEGYLRLSYCTAEEKIKQGLQRLEKYLKEEY